MNRLIGIGSILVVVTTLLGCSSGFSFVSSNDRSEQRAGERVTVTILPEQDYTGEVALPALLAAAIPIAIDYGFSLVEKEIKREEQRYASEYGGFGVGDGFYNATGTEGSGLGASPASPTMEFQGLLIERSITRAAADKAVNSETAMKLQLDAQQSLDGRYFRLVPATIELPYSKCKLRRGDEEADIEIRLTLHTYWIDEKGVARAEALNLPPVLVPGIPVGPKDQWTKEQNARVAGHFAKVPSTWIPMVPRSTQKSGDAVVHGRGTFAFSVQVKEYDDFGKRVGTVGELVKKNRDNWAKELANAILGESKE